MARDRFDGTAVPNVHPVRRIMPFIMPTKNGAFVLFEHDIPTAPLIPFLADANRDRPADRPITMFHCVLRAIGIALNEFPRLNRYVSGSRLYARKSVWLAFSAKQRLERDAPLFTAKVEVLPDEPLGAFVDRILSVLGDGRSGKESHADREIKGFLKLPGPVLRAAVKMQRVLDGWNLLPSSLLADDPLYASAFIANLGSVGLDAAFHHLYEYGTIPIFVVVGAYRRVAVVEEDGRIVAQRVATLKYTYDERVEDGFYCARAVSRMKELIEHPAELA